ncbi:hypothetical protein [Bibersteinia trehalosi]|uniref:hypothetical protein n=1 Tax=Bibersteinia trehalosi TaxID=47735 RepID=UPI001E37648B|nr:hypothetical protein [Bibersteinia trehalosi]
MSKQKNIFLQESTQQAERKRLYLKSVTCDARRGLLKDFFDTPTQICQYHMVAIVMRALRKKHQSDAGRELKTIVKTLKESSKNEFYLRLYYCFEKHKAFLNERSDKPNEKGKYPYKHRAVRSAYASLVRYCLYRIFA